MSQRVSNAGETCDVGMDAAGIPPYDYFSCTYTGSNLTSIVYKSGGASGTTVATVTMTYDGSDNLLTWTRV